MAVTTFKQVQDNKSATLNVTVGLADLNITLDPGQGSVFPNSFPYFVSCDYEVMTVSAKAGDILTVTRAQDGTTAAVHNKGSVVEMRGNAGLWNDVYNAVNNIENGTNPAAVATLANSIANNTVDSSKIIDGSINDADIASGAAITSTKLAGYPWHNADLATDVARANQLTNGGFELWQRGNGPFTANQAFAADRWQISLAGTSTLSVSKDTTNIDGSSAASAALTYVHNTESLFFQKLEDLSQLRGRTLSLSVRVRTATANAVRLAISYDATRVYSTYHNGNGAWQTLSVTVAVPANAGSLYANVVLDLSCTAYVDNAMLVIGTVAADYVPLHPSEDLKRCERYYERLADDNDGALIVSGISSAGVVTLRETISYKAAKPVMPTVTKIGTWTVGNAGQPAPTSVGTKSCWLITNTVGAGDAYAYNTGAGCNITVEANP